MPGSGVVRGAASRLCAGLLPLVLLAGHLCAQAPAYSGFDKNAYPGDVVLPALHQDFSFAGYWLNNPPGMSGNPWAGKRKALREAGFGFLLLFNGRLDTELKAADAVALGRADGAQAAKAAGREHFPLKAIIFLDQEEGGALLPEQAAYISAWITAVHRGGYVPGVYCSGIAVAEGSGSISTARELLTRYPDLALWVAEDECPPAPGCAVAPQDPGNSGFALATAWQAAQSPRRPQFAASCAATYAADGNCYAPHAPGVFLDIDYARSADPSGGR